ncbi:MAG: putative metal-binding motif-containing protein [Myxococcota bacterium]
MIDVTRDGFEAGRSARTLAVAAGVALVCAALLLAACSDDGVNTPSKGGDADIYVGTDPDADGAVDADAGADIADAGRGRDVSDAEHMGGDGDADAESDTEEDTDVGPCPGCFRHPCDEASDCFSEYCVDSPEGQVCSKTCQSGDSCPQGWSCSQVSTGGDPKFMCVPYDTFLCRPCQSDADCNAVGLESGPGVCIDTGLRGSFCTRRCDQDSTCMEGFICRSLENYKGRTLDLCTPEEGGGDPADECSCTPKFVEELAETTCSLENEHGTCKGTLMCVEVGPLPECSAPEPQAEVCNGLDDDCDGETDEDAVDCTNYYKDSDGDGYGQGSGECFCDDPGEGWILDGGDCNELVTAINPGAPEVCNGLDDNCDGVTDEQDAQGCETHYLDQDGDGYGQDEVTACLCDGEEGWAPEPGDCNDLNPAANPEAEEICDGIDNNCDGRIDEEGALDCNVFFLDQDGDGYGLTDKVKCLCGPTGAYVGSKPNDCDDTTAQVNPSMPELCNGIDDNCNGDTDEGEPASMCPEVAHGTAGCVDGECSLIECEAGWSDVDQDPLNGCECPIGSLEDPGGPGNACNDPHLLGTISDAGGTPIEVTDNISPSGDEDWYQFTAIDGPEAGGCDTFDLRVLFLHNPQGQFAFDVFEGGCPASSEICKEVQEFSDSTDFLTDSGGEPLGECDCDPDYTDDGVQMCSDQTMLYIVRVYRREGFENSCAAYTLRISNGL